MVLAGATSSLLFTGAAFAAEQKIAVVDIQTIIQQIPQAAKVMQALEAEFKDEKAVLAQLEKDIQYNQEKKKRDGSLMSPKELEDIDKKIAMLFQEYQTTGQAFQQATTRRQNEETGKLIGLVRQAVDNIAAEKDYDLVLEKKAAVFAKPEHSITDEVIKTISKLK